MLTPTPVKNHRQGQLSGERIKRLAFFEQAPCLLEARLCHVPVPRYNRIKKQENSLLGVFFFKKTLQI